MLHLFETIVAAIVNILKTLDFWGVGIGMMIESACIPLPSEVILPLGGFMASDGTITLFEANAAAAIGSIIGSLIAYYVGYYGGRPFILKYGKYFFVSEKHFYQADKTFNKYGISAIFFGRLLPVIRTFISLPAGIARIDIKKFLLYSLLGMLPWNFLLIFLGYKFGDNYAKIIHPIFKRFEYFVIAAIIIAIALFVFYYFYSKKKNSK